MGVGQMRQSANAIGKASRVRKGIATRFYQFRMGKVMTNEICAVSSRELESGGRSA
jgi:hypothetical protein